MTKSPVPSTVIASVPDSRTDCNFYQVRSMSAKTHLSVLSLSCETVPPPPLYLSTEVLWMSQDASQLVVQHSKPLLLQNSLSVPLSRLLHYGPSNQERTCLGFLLFFLMWLFTRDTSLPCIQISFPLLPVLKLCIRYLAQLWYIFPPS